MTKLLKYGAKNFFCFKEGFEISFESGANCPTNANTFSNILCVKGANGSGKTNALKALCFLEDFSCNSWNEKPNSPINVLSFFLNNQPIEFFIDFSISKIQYRYELSLTIKSVLSEIIFRKEKRMTKIVERKNNQLMYCSKDYKELKTIKMRGNASIVSTANQYEIMAMKPIYKFFQSITSNMSSLSGLSDVTLSANIISRFYHKNKDVFDFVKKIICNCDLGISDITIKKSKNKTGNDSYISIFHYEIKDKKPFLTLDFQSSGTKELFHKLPHYKLALDSGGIVVADEFDIHLHPHILPVLFNLFTNKEINKKNTQLIFTTHNTEIMDLLGKYRTIFINKEENESYSYRLDDIPGDIIRNDRPISPIYNSGKIGGVPRL